MPEHIKNTSKHARRSFIAAHHAIDYILVKALVGRRLMNERQVVIYPTLISRDSAAAT